MGVCFLFSSSRQELVLSGKLSLRALGHKRLCRTPAERASRPADAQASLRLSRLLEGGCCLQLSVKAKGREAQGGGIGCCVRTRGLKGDLPSSGQWSRLAPVSCLCSHRAAGALFPLVSGVAKVGVLQGCGRGWGAVGAGRGVRSGGSVFRVLGDALGAFPGASGVSHLPRPTSHLPASLQTAA